MKEIMPTFWIFICICSFTIIAVGIYIPEVSPLAMKISFPVLIIGILTLWALEKKD